MYATVSPNGTWKTRYAVSRILLLRRKAISRPLTQEIRFFVLMKEEPRLIEQAFGVWEGTSPRNSRDFYQAKLNFINSFGTGESMFRVAQRIYNLLDDLKSDDHTYILVAHNGIARFVKSYFQDLGNEEFAAFGIQNAEVCEFEF